MTTGVQSKAVGPGRIPTFPVSPAANPETTTSSSKMKGNWSASSLICNLAVFWTPSSIPIGFSKVRFKASFNSGSSSLIMGIVKVLLNSPGLKVKLPEVAS